MNDEPDYILDINGLDEPTSPDSDAAAHASDAADLADHVSDDSHTAGGAPDAGRQWIGIQFECCGIYTRIYRNRAGSAYQGNCPRCQRPVRVRIGPGGTPSRLFRAG